MRKSGGFYAGWKVAAGCAVVTGAGVGLFSNCIGVFVKPVCEALSFSRAAFSLCSTLTILVGAFTLPFYGEWFRKRSVKWTMLFCAAVCGAVPVGYSFSSQLWQFYLLASVNGLTVSGITMLSVGTLINRWFEGKKGLALGLSYAGSGVVASIMIPVTEQVVAAFGWAWGYRLIGGVGLGLLIPSILFLVQDGPKDGAEPKQKRAPKGGGTQGMTRAEALRAPVFWCVSAGLFLANLVNLGMFNHTIPYLTDLGLDPPLASKVMAAAMIAMIGAKLAVGWMVDRFGILWGSAAMAGGLGLAAAALIAAAAFSPAVWAYAVMIGFGATVNGIFASYDTARYFGEREYPRIFALLSMASSFGSAAGAPIAGAVFDRMETYLPAWWGAASLAAGALLLLCGAELRWGKRDEEKA